MANIQDVTRRLSSTRSKLRGGRGRALLNAGFIILMLGVIGFAVYQVARHMTVGLNTLRTQEILDESYVQLELYVFRDESVLVAEGSDTYLYDVANGERVGVGRSLGIAYRAGDAATAADLQKRLNAYGERISLLEKLGGLGTPADARDAADAVDRDYLGLLEAAGSGDLSAVAGYADSMQDGLGRYDIITGASGNQSLAALKTERNALVEGLPRISSMSTQRSGYFYYDCDGYESVFDYASALTMTPEEFRAMTERSANRIPAGTVGKMVYSPTWYAAAYIPLSDGAIELFQQGIVNGATYTMLCGGSAGLELNMTIVRMVPDENGALVVFSSQDMPKGFAFERSFRAETVALQTTGYRIPAEAVVTLHSKETGEDVTGVYILAGNVVEFRKIRIRVRRDGYIIADTYEDVKAYLDTLSDEEYAERTADGWSYLGLNDNIITSGNELYEGKVIS
ncbi:MAG: hypothetical protein IKU90_03930 [Clostridia bacterium]|nr:hypothetical protein [Clostridia bacterium]